MVIREIYERFIRWLYGPPKPDKIVEDIKIAAVRLLAEADALQELVEKLKGLQDEYYRS